MDSEADQLSRAVTLFLAYGTAASPRQDDASLTREFGERKAAELRPRLVSLLSELGAIDVDWSRHELVSAGKMARAEMQARHPELSEDALRALEWKFTFDWR
jgi:hypothetical protein